jgi:ribosomal-protein-serine acetyltransferase
LGWLGGSARGRWAAMKDQKMKPILLEIPEQFETERLLISNYQKGDGNEFYQLILSNCNHLQEELGETKALKTIEDAEEYVRIKRVAWLSRERLVPKIVEKTTGRMIGQLWIEPKWDRMIFEIGYFVEEKSQGNGYVTEAVKKMIEFLFTGLDANKLEIHVKATNTRSIGVAKRCGFTKEAQLRERGRTNDGEIVDLEIYGLLRSEFPLGF